jgi:hypothetical protein
LVLAFYLFTKAENYCVISKGMKKTMIGRLILAPQWPSGQQTLTTRGTFNTKNGTW